MKRMNKMLLVAALAATTLSAQAEQKKGPAWLSDALFYQIYPSSYMDTDGNGIGDLPGITSKLDYIKSLGVNALWLNPIFESGWFDGGYDVIDFYKVDPRFGTNTDLVTLVNEAHKRGMKVCLDLVAGHSSTKCAWFKESSEKDPNQRYSDYYIWMNDIPESEKKEIEARHHNPIQIYCAVRIEVGDTEKFIDMLFYNTQRHCYVVVEIKTGKFDSSYAGQLGTYVVAVNHQMKTKADNPTLGLLICKDMDKVEAQYALESTCQPLGISSYELSKLIPEEFRGSMPTIEEIEAELNE